MRDDAGVSGEQAPRIELKPAGTAWRGKMSGFDIGQELLGRRVGEWRELMREELVVRGEGPVFAAGHEPVVWHPGVLAKYIAVEAMARGAGGRCVNLVVDTHREDAGVVEAPVRGEDGRLGVERVRVAEMEAEQAMGIQAARAVRGPVRVQGETWGFVWQGLERTARAIGGRAGEANLALQMAQAMDDLRVSMGCGERRMDTVCATRLLTTSLWRALAKEMVKDSRRCAETYNTAAAWRPGADVEMLGEQGGNGGVELPVWVVERGGGRRRGYAADVQAWLRDAGAVQLEPRALVTTALARIGLADIFVHGRGGWNYDAVMEQWMMDWLGVTAGVMMLVSADVFLPLGVEKPGSGGVEGAIAIARRMEHDPPVERVIAVSDASALGMMETVEAAVVPQEGALPTAWKKGWISRIAALARGSAERRSAYRSMHEELAQRREAASAVIRAGREEVERERGLLEDWRVASRRDWAFSLYPQVELAAMRRAIEEQIG